MRTVKLRLRYGLASCRAWHVSIDEQLPDSTVLVARALAACIRPAGLYKHARTLLQKA